jgi:hypothetical protein
MISPGFVMGWAYEIQPNAVRDYTARVQQRQTGIVEQAASSLFWKCAASRQVRHD